VAGAEQRADRFSIKNEAHSAGPALIRRLAAGLAFPHAVQAIRLTRRIRPISSTKKWQTVTIYVITSLIASQATPAQLAGWIRGHWQIEAIHHIRDVTYGEDASQVRTGNGPHVMASLRILWPSPSSSSPAPQTSPPPAAATPRMQPAC